MVGALFRTSHRPPNETTGGTTAKNRAQKLAKVRSLYTLRFISRPIRRAPITDEYIRLAFAVRVYCPRDSRSSLYMARGDPIERAIKLRNWARGTNLLFARRRYSPRSVNEESIHLGSPPLSRNVFAELS